MAVVVGVPPLFDLIDEKFHVAGKRVLFSWGPGTIYNPGGKPIPPELVAHEQAHGARQTDAAKAIEAWWRKYIEDAEFRLHEEILGHRAEYADFCRRNKDRNARVFALQRMAARLASPLYLEMVSIGMARDAIAGMA